MYWEYPDKTMPEYIKLCIQTVVKHKGSLNLNLLDQDSINQYIPHLRPEWYKLKKKAHKADYVRTRLIYKYGGMWLDCDIAAFKSVEPLLDFSESYDYACQSICCSIGCFVARPGCKLLKIIMEEQDKILDKGFRDLKWNGIGNGLLAKFGENYEYYQWLKWTLAEIPGGKVSKLFLKNETIEKNVDKNAVFFHFCNEVTGPLIEKYAPTTAKLLASKMLISKIFRKALGLEEKYGNYFSPFEMIQQLILKNVLLRKIYKTIRRFL